MVEHYLWTENRSETDHFVLNHCHRIQTVNSFWGLMLSFLSKPDWICCCWTWLIVGPHEQNTPPSRSTCWTFLIYIHNCWRDWGVSQCWRCLVQHCWRQSLGNKTKVIRWLVGLIRMVWGNSFLWNLSVLDQFEIFRFYSLRWLVFLVVSQTPLYLCHTWFS